MLQFNDVLKMSSVPFQFHTKHALLDTPRLWSLSRADRLQSVSPAPSTASHRSKELPFEMFFLHFFVSNTLKTTKLHGLSPQANYTDRATAACRRSDC
jgi:hypothetical protein